MSVIAINFPTETIQALNLIANEKGKTAEQYIREMVETEILAAKPLRENLADALTRQDTEVTQSDVLCMQ